MARALSAAGVLSGAALLAAAIPAGAQTTCLPLGTTPPLLTTCTGTTSGDLDAGSDVSITFLTSNGTTTVTGSTSSDTSGDPGLAAPATATPELGSLALFGSGLAAAAGAGWRGRRSGGWRRALGLGVFATLAAGTAQGAWAMAPGNRGPHPVFAAAASFPCAGPGMSCAIAGDVTGQWTRAARGSGGTFSVTAFAPADALPGTQPGVGFQTSAGAETFDLPSLTRPAQPVAPAATTTSGTAPTPAPGGATASPIAPAVPTTSPGPLPGVTHPGPQSGSTGSSGNGATPGTGVLPGWPAGAVGPLPGAGTAGGALLSGLPAQAGPALSGGAAAGASTSNDAVNDLSTSAVGVTGGDGGSSDSSAAGTRGAVSQIRLALMSPGDVTLLADGTVRVWVPGRPAPVYLQTGTLPRMPDEWCAQSATYRSYIRLDEPGLGGVTYGVAAGGALDWVPPQDAGCVDWSQVGPDVTFPMNIVMQFPMLAPREGALLWVLSGPVGATSQDTWYGRLYEATPLRTARYVTAQQWAAAPDHYASLWANTLPVSALQVLDLAAQGVVDGAPQ